MGFTQVFLSLSEIFPQIDARILRAVAIENSKDIDKAVEAVLSDVIPSLSTFNGESSNFSKAVSVPSWPAWNGESSNFSDGVSDEESSQVSSTMSLSRTGHRLLCEPPKDVILSVPVLPVDDKLSEGEEHDSFAAFHRLHSNSEPNGVVDHSEVPNALLDDVHIDHITEIFNEEQINTHEEDSLTTLGIIEIVNTEIEEGSSEKQLVDDGIHQKLQNYPGEGVFNESAYVGKKLGESLFSTSTSTSAPTIDLETSTVQESTMSSLFSQSTQKHITEVIEGLISHAKNDKKELSSAMLLIRNLIKEVEIKEKAAEEARVNASMVLADALGRVEELKKVVDKAEQKKCMYAGDVYGEKAIQATELKELHLRVLSLSNERDKSLDLLDEMRQSLEARLAAAENGIINVAREKEEKEKAATEACAEQELALQKVMEEMMMLEQLKQDNVAVHEFLLDRGHVVDALQGEIAVAYQDVMQLKEKLDENVPLSKLVSSSYSWCSAPSPPICYVETEDGWELFESPATAPELS